MEDKDVYKDLGRFENQINNLTSAISEMRQEDKEHREMVREKLQVLDKLESDLEIAKPMLKDIDRWKERVVGAVMLAGAVSATVSFFIGDIVHYIRVKLGW